MRLNRFLAAAGLGSRRGCEELIRAGRVTINGQVCTDLATNVADEDFVKVNGRRAQPQRQLYVLLHKPRGYLCTASDTHERRTVFDLLPREWPRLFHVGRLDKESEGLLILTNDGDLSLRLTHPRYKVEKEYEVLLDRPFDFAADRVKLLKGMTIEGGWAKAEFLQKLSNTALRVVLRQGLKRQIRLMFDALDYKVKALMRTRIGSLRIENLRRGEWRFLSSREIKSLLGENTESDKRPPREKGSVSTAPPR
jgi:23S rRNA pseudouridine2605 synthase